MKLLVFLAIVALVSAAIDERQYRRSSSREDDEREETMQFIAGKRNRVNNIDWDNFNPSAAKNRGPARGARISAFLNKLDANNIPPSDKIYETKSDVKTPKKPSGYTYVPSYQSPMKTTASGFKTKMTPDVASSTPKFKVKESGHGSYKTSLKRPSLSLEITYKTPQGSVDHEESSTESPTPKYQAKRSGYGSYESDSDDESEVVRPPAPMSKLNMRNREPSIKSPTPKYQGKKTRYEADSNDESEVVRPPVPMSKINMRTKESSAESTQYKYKPRSSGYGSNQSDSDDESPVVRPPAQTSKINMRSQESTAKSTQSKYKPRSSGHGSYESDLDDESPVVRPPAQTSKINMRTQESSDKSTLSKYQTKSYDSYAVDSKYISPAVKSSTEESEMRVTSPPAFSKSSRPTYQTESSGHSSYEAAPHYASSGVKKSVPEPNMHATPAAVFSRSTKPSHQMKSPASIHVNNAEVLTPLSATDGKKSDETPVESTNKLHAARSFWSSSSTKGHEGLMPNIKLPSPSAKIPKPLVPRRNSDTATTVPSFAATSEPTTSLEMNTPATKKSSPPPPSWMHTAKIMSNSQYSPMNMAQLMKSNQETSDEIGGSIKTREIPQELPGNSNDGTVYEKAGIYKRGQPSTFKPSFYTFPKIPNKHVAY